MTTSPTLRAAFSSKRKDTDELVDTTELTIVSILRCTAGAERRFEMVMEVSATLLEAESDTATVRDARLAVCVLELVVTPVATLTVHAV